MLSGHSTNDDDIALGKLREILLGEDRDRIAELKSLLTDSDLLAEKIDPIIEQHLDALKQQFPDSYVRVIEKLIDRRLQESQEELVNILYPRLGLMVKGYIADQFRLLREGVDQQIRQSPFSFILRNRHKSTDEVIMDLSPFRIEEVYIISHESGLLLGSASASNAADKDMVAGMLTAIKAFVEDAFHRSNEELRGIHYREYEILIHNFYNYYIALAVAGTSSEQDRDLLGKTILEFASNELNTRMNEQSDSLHGHLQKQLTHYFIQPSVKEL